MTKNIQINVGNIFEKYIGNFEKIIHIFSLISAQVTDNLQSKKKTFLYDAIG